MEALDHQRKNVVMILLKQTQNYLLIEKEFLNLKLTIKMLTFQLNFVSEVFLMDLVILHLEEYL